MIKPIGRNFVVETIEEGTSSLILLNPEKTQKGKVVSRGSKLSEEIKVGAVVSFARYAGTEVKEDGKTYLILEERDILAYEE